MSNVGFSGVSNYVNTSSGLATSVIALDAVSGAGVTTRPGSGPDVAPTLDLNFISQAYSISGVSKTFTEAITFTRTTTATYINASGAITPAAINEPRFDYDPVTLLPRGLLIEESRVNRVLNSATLVSQSVTVTNVPYALSFYGTGVVTLTGAHTAVVVGAGAYPTRTTLLFTPSAGTLIIAVVGSAINAQLEQGTFATSYIPTLAAQVTRGQDLATANLFGTWYNALTGTLYAHADSNDVSTARVPFIVNNGTTANRIQVGIGNGAARGFVSDANVTQYTRAIPTVVTTNMVPAKVALAYQASNFGVAINGTLTTDGMSGTVPTVTTPRIGAIFGVSGTLNGHVRAVLYYPTRLVGSQLAVITTL